MRGWDCDGLLTFGAAWKLHGKQGNRATDGKGKVLGTWRGVRVNLTFISPDEWPAKKCRKHCGTVDAAAAAATWPLLLGFL